MKPAILGVIMEHFTAGRPVLADDAASGDEGHSAGEDNEIVSQIKELLDTSVRPAVAQDGGDIVFRGFSKDVVFLPMQGACSGCPTSPAALQMGTEKTLRQ